MAKTLKYLFASTYFGYSVSLLHADTAHLLTDLYFSSSVKDGKLLKIAEKNYLKALALNNLDGPLYVDVASFYASDRAGQTRRRPIFPKSSRSIPTVRNIASPWPDSMQGRGGT